MVMGLEDYEATLDVGHLEDGMVKEETGREEVDWELIVVAI